MKRSGGGGVEAATPSNGGVARGASSKHGGGLAAASSSSSSSSAMPSTAFPYAVKAKKLLEDLRRADWVPRYDAEGVLAALAECDALMEEIRKVSSEFDQGELVENYDQLATVLCLHHSLARNKRCLLAYHHHRLEALEELFWDTGKPVLDKPKAEKLSELEMDYYREFQSLMGDLAQELDVDLTLNMDPPKELVVEVRSLSDYGEVMTEYGSVRLTKDSTLFMRRVDAEPLIRQGVLEQL